MTTPTGFPKQDSRCTCRHQFRYHHQEGDSHYCSVCISLQARGNFLYESPHHHFLEDRHG